MRATYITLKMSNSHVLKKDEFWQDVLFNSTFKNIVIWTYNQHFLNYWDILHFFSLYLYILYFKQNLIQTGYISTLNRTRGSSIRQRGSRRRKYLHKINKPICINMQSWKNTHRPQWLHIWGVSYRGLLLCKWYTFTFSEFFYTQYVLINYLKF